MNIKKVNKSKHMLPSYSTNTIAGMGINANIDNDIILNPLQRTLVKYELYLGIPVVYEAQVRPTRGLAIKHRITVINTPGTIDADYRGEIGITLINLSDENFVIRDGERICQMIIAKHEKAEWENVDALIETDRGNVGFAHTGKE